MSTDGKSTIDSINLLFINQYLLKNICKGKLGVGGSHDLWSNQLLCEIYKMVCDRNSWYMVVELSDKKNRHFVIVSQYHAILCNTIQYHHHAKPSTPYTIRSNTINHHAIPWYTIQYYNTIYFNLLSECDIWPAD